MGAPRIEGTAMMITATPLSAEQLRKLGRIQHYATRYEVELAFPNGDRKLVCYTDSRSLSGFLSMIRKRWAPIVKAVGVADDAEAHRIGKAKAYRFENGVIIRMSGRTQRDAIMSGELPFIGGAA